MTAQATRGGTVTLLFADVAGSTRLLSELGDAYGQLLADYRRITTEAAEAEGGTLIDTAGDGLFISFPTARGALNAALAAQRAFHGHAWPSGVQLEVRMGIHTGEPLADSTSLVGLDVHRAARICAAGHGGQILVSLTTRDLLGADTAGAALRDLGEHRLKDLPHPERLYQVTGPDLPSEFPPLRSIDNWPNNLPRHLSTFVGRTDALAEVSARLGTTPLLTLTGPGGVGKTRLALEAAAQSMDEFPDGAWVVELGGLGDSGLVPETVAAALRIKEEPGVRLEQTLVHGIGVQRMLLVFDDCEHVLEAVAQLIDHLLRGCEGLRVVATSREALAVPGESLYAVPSLDLPAPDPDATLADLEAVEAVRLFVDRARAVHPGFVLNERNAPAVAHICRRLDGIPLAIELAAARAKALPPEQIAARLDDRFRLLTGGSRMALPRHRTLKAAMDWSYDLLADAERALFVRLSVFAGSFSLEAVEAVCVGDPVDQIEVLDLVSRLIDRSLVAVEEGAEARYRLLDTVQQYGQERLLEEDATGIYRTRHRRHMVELVDHHGPTLFAGPGAAPAAQRLAAEHENLRAALQWSDDDPDGADDELRLAAGLWRYWELAGYLVEGRNWLARALARTDGEISELRANALTGLASLAAQQGDLAAATAAHEEALAAQRTLGNPMAIAYACSNLANTAVERGDYARARDLYEESVAISRGAQDERGAAFAMMNLADVVSRQGDAGEAERLYDEALAISRASGDLMGVALALGRRATFSLQQGRTADARDLHNQALEIYRSFGDGRGEARTMMFLGDIVAVEGDLAEAERLYRISIDQRGALHDRAGLATACDRLARVLAMDDPERAAQLIGYADGQREAISGQLPPADRSERDQLIALLQDRLGERFAAQRTVGRRMRLEAILPGRMVEG